MAPNQYDLIRADAEINCDDIIKDLLAEARKQKLTPQLLTHRMGIPYSAAHKILTGKARRPTLATVVALAYALGRRLELRS